MTISRIAACLAFALALAASPAAAHGAAEQPPRTLFLVPIASEHALARFEDVGLPLYARFRSGEVTYLLAGADDAAVFEAAGLPARPLDDIADADYFLAHLDPDLDRAGLASLGAVLMADDHVALVRVSPAGAARAAPPDIPLTRITLAPKPLRPAAAATFPPVSSPDPITADIIAQIDAADVHRITGELSGEWPAIIDGAAYTLTTRATDSGEPAFKATRYAGEHLAASGLAVDYHYWMPSAPPNVIGELTGESRPEDIFILSAHLDDRPYAGAAPGADDNASGSTAVLVAADILARYRWDCTLRFALWMGEEQGMRGSRSYAAAAQQQQERILGVLNLDMIAWNTADSPADIELHADSRLPATVEMANQFAGVVTAYDLGLIPEVIPDGIGYSDHASFWDQGFPAILGIEDFSSDFNPFYHTSQDRLARLDMAYYTRFVRAAVGSLVHMSDCLLTGTLAGHVTAAHDGSPISGAALDLSSTAGWTYATSTDAAGAYAYPVPLATYAISATAYGYLPARVDGVDLTTPGADVQQDFVLRAAPPVAPAVHASLSDGRVRLAWAHVAPDAAYAVHRHAAPYGRPDAGILASRIDPPFPEPVTFLAEGGDPGETRFHRVLGLNAAGEWAASGEIGEFRFALAPGDLIGPPREPAAQSASRAPAS